MLAAALAVIVAVAWLLAFATPAHATTNGWTQRTELALPFSGTGYVTQGWGGAPTHTGNLEYAWDFVLVDWRGWAYSRGGSRLTDYVTWGAPVLAPADGKVVAVQATAPDNPIDHPDAANPWGNYVVLDHGNGEYSMIAHFQQHSITVKPGDQVRRGQTLGRAGNSGLSYKPHIHYQLQDSPSLNARSLPAHFASYNQLSFFRRILRTAQAPAEGTFIRNAA